MQNPLKGIPRNTFILGAASFLNDIASEMIAPLLPVFLTTVLGAGPAVIGLIEGTAEATSSLLKVVSGYISDRTGRRKGLVLLGYSVAAIARPAISISITWLQVLILRFIDRIGKGIRTAPRDAIIADSTEPKYRGKSFGLHRTLDHAGAVAGPIIAFLLINTWNFNFRLIFAAALIPGLLSALFIFIFVREGPFQKSGQAFAPHFKNIDRNFRNYLAVLFLFTLGNASDAFLILRAVDAGLSVSMIPLLWGGFNLIKFIVSTPGGHLSDSVGRRPIIIIGWMLYALIYALFAFASSPMHIALIFAGYGIYYGLTEGVERAFVADIVASNIRATAYGLYNAAIGIAAFPASVIFGLIWKQLGMQAAFFYSVALAFISSIGLMIFVKPRIAHQGQRGG